MMMTRTEAVGAGIKIGEIIQEFVPEEGAASPLQAYVQVAATLDGKEITLAVVVGVPDYLQGTAQAAGAGVRPYLSTWWADASDWQDVPQTRRNEASEALAEEASRLWAEVESMRAEVQS